MDTFHNHYLPKNRTRKRILCAEGNQEQVELLQLDKTNIKVAEYIIKQEPKELLAKKLH